MGGGGVSLPRVQGKGCGTETERDGAMCEERSRKKNLKKHSF